MRLSEFVRAEVNRVMAFQRQMASKVGTTPTTEEAWITLYRDFCDGDEEEAVVGPPDEEFPEEVLCGPPDEESDEEEPDTACEDAVVRAKM